MNLIDRIPKILSLLSLLGLIGLAGVFNPQLARFSALSFMSYLCYFRFFRWFVQPHPRVDATALWIWIVGAIVGGLAITMNASLFSLSPMLGLLGFAGLLGLYEPRNAPQTNNPVER